MIEAITYFLKGTAVVSNQNTYWHLSLLEDRLVYTFFALFCLIGMIWNTTHYQACALTEILARF